MKNLVFTTHRTITDISKEMWNSFVDDSRISIQYDHLKAIELSKINNHIPGYITIFDTETNQYIGIAYYIVINMDMSKTTDDIKPDSIKTIREWYPDFIKLNLLECGLLTGTGKAYSIDSNREKEVLPYLLEKIDADGKEFNVDFVLIRDIDKKSYDGSLAVFENKQYSPFLGYESAVMHHNFETFGEYYNSLRSSKRKDVRKSQAKLRQAGVTVHKADSIAKHSETLTKLWQQVSEKSDSYSHEELTPEYFNMLDSYFADNTDLFLVKECEKIIAFVLCFEGDREYNLCFAGFDTELNKKYDLYFNLYYIAMEEGFRKGKGVLDMGLTTYDVKAKIGCTTRPNAYFIKNIKDEKASFSLAKLFADSFEHPKNGHRAFLDGIDTGSVTYEPIIIPKAADDDIFAKVDDYHRINLLKLMDCYSFFPPFESAQQGTVQHHGRTVGMFGSNSYLGLANDNRVKTAAKEAIKKYGTGCAGSTLMNGNLDLHSKLSKELSKWFGKEDCNIFSTGYLANLGVIGALAKSSDMVILDEFSHGSIIDGALFSKAKIARYRHNNLEYLERLLSRFSDLKKLVIADSVFSMEGTVVNLPELVRVCKKYNARVVLDEAHAIGVYGPTGAGVAEHFGLIDEIDVITGTFSKSCSSIGGFAVSSSKIIDFLKHNSRPSIFTASLPPAAVATVLKAIEIIQTSPERRKKVVENANYLAEGLLNLGYEVHYNNTAIVPVFCRDELVTLSLFKKLMDLGVYVNPVLHPGVAKGGELLRISCMAIHTKKDIDRLLGIFASVRTDRFPATKKYTIEESKSISA